MKLIRLFTSGVWHAAIYPVALDPNYEPPLQAACDGSIWQGSSLEVVIWDGEPNCARQACMAERRRAAPRRKA